nr:immunoglobulin light chain junction region [Macaca mulatta]
DYYCCSYTSSNTFIF